MRFEWLPHPNSLSQAVGEKECAMGWGKRWLPALGWGHLGKRDASGWVILEKEGYGWEMGLHPCSTEPGRGEMPPHGLHNVGFPPPEGTEPLCASRKRR